MNEQFCTWKGLIYSSLDNEFNFLMPDVQGFYGQWIEAVLTELKAM